MSQSFYSRENPVPPERLQEIVERDGFDVFKRAEQAVMNVLQRLQRTVDALQSAEIPYAIIGGHAVAAWVSTIDPGAVRNTVDVDVLLRREDLERVKSVMADAGFKYHQIMGIDMFLDGPDGRAREAVHVLYAGEPVKKNERVPTPDVDRSIELAGKSIVRLDALVAMKLTSYRDKDKTHLRDMIDVGLIDESWPDQFESPLNERLQALIDDPLG